YARSDAQLAQAEGHAAGHGEEGLDQELVDLIESDGRSRPLASRADTPAPADRSVTVTPPLAANDASTYQVEGASEPAGSAVAQAPKDAEAADAAGEEAAGEQEAAAGAEGPADEAAEAEEPAAESADVAAAPVAWDEAQGAQVYTSTCSVCHQGAGQGIPGAFPPLANHAADIYAAGGEEFLIQVLLFGMQGQIQVEGMTYNGLMPGWASLGDDAIANVLNHLVVNLGDGAPDGFRPYVAADVAGHRGDGLDATEVHEIRNQLGL